MQATEKSEQQLEFDIDEIIRQRILDGKFDPKTDSLLEQYVIIVREHSKCSVVA